MTDFGGKLRQAREQRGVSLRQIAASTKITISALEALERNDVSKLPGGIFSRAFVRSYAVEVGLDPEATVREFLEHFHADPAPSATSAPVTVQESGFESEQRAALTVLALVAISVIAIVAILYLTWRGRSGAQPAAAPIASSAPGPVAPPAPPVEASGVPVQMAGTSPLPAARTEGFTLELHPTAACWISLRIDGEPQFSRVVQAGERIARSVREVAVLEVGDAAAFAYSINGRPGRSLGAAGQVRRAQITPSSLQEYLR